MSLLEPLFASLDLPVLVLWGAEDRWLEPEKAERLARRIPGAGVQLVPGAGHFAMEDEPDAVAAALAAFFAG